MKHKNRGFTLVEMLVAMGILVVGITTILGLLAFGAALQRTAEKRTEVALAADQVIADLREMFELTEDGSVSDVPGLRQERAIPGHPNLTARVDLVKNPSLPGEYFAIIQVLWSERGRLRSEEFRTILEREVPFGRRVERELRAAPGAR